MSAVAQVGGDHGLHHSGTCAVIYRTCTGGLGESYGALWRLAAVYSGCGKCRLLDSPRAFWGAACHSGVRAVDVQRARMTERGCFPSTILARPRRPCRPCHPYAVSRTSVQFGSTRHRNCTEQLSPSPEYEPGISPFSVRLGGHGLARGECCGECVFTHGGIVRMGRGSSLRSIT
jgi:hypothetical protein